MMSRVWLWLRSVIFRGRYEREMQEEMRAHLQRAAERLEASGLSRADARAAARREFGNVSAIQDDARDARGGQGLESVLADLRYGARALARTPFSALTMIVVFALGIGANATLFLFISSMVNSPLPGMSRDDSLVRIRGIERRPGANIGREFSYPEYRDYASQTSLFSSVAAWTSADVVLGVGGTSDTAGQDSLFSGAATYVTSNYFPVLGVLPIRGAGLPAGVADAGGDVPLVAVISYQVWDRCFGLAPDVVGRALKVNDTSVTIVGVAPRRFSGARTGGSSMRVWMPFSTRAVVQRTTPDLTSYDDAFLGLAARLAPGATPEQATPSVAAIAARAGQLVSAQSGGMRSSDVVPMLAGNYFPPSGEAPDMLSRASSLAIPILILLVTCTNVSALLAGLAIARRREMAVRLSLGAARRRLVRQLVTESVLLAVTAGALALFVIWILLRLVESTVAEVYVVIDWRVILFTLTVALVAGIMFGLSPALHGTRVPLSEVLKDSAGGVIAARSRLQSGLVVAQIALTQPLLLGMGALLLEIREDVRKIPSPAYADRVLDVRFNTNPRYGVLDRAREDRLRHLQDRLMAVPGVLAIVPQENTDVFIEAAVHRSDEIVGGDTRLVLRAQAAPSGYFALMGISIVRGRDFDAAQREDPASVVIGESAARRLWPDADPIGKRFVGHSPTRRGSVFTVVGVVDEARTGQLDVGNEIRVFVPSVSVTGHFLIRTQAPAQPMAPVIRAVAVAEAPELPLVSVRTLEAIESGQRTSLSRATTGIAGAGALALFLSAIGLYAVVAFAVRQRVREIGIRTALGAGRQDVVRWFLLRGVRLSGVGMAVGLTLSLIVVRLMASVRGEDPPSGVIGLAAGVAIVAIVVTLIATWIPARRAAAVDPLLALRTE